MSEVVKIGNSYYDVTKDLKGAIVKMHLLDDEELKERGITG